MGASVAGEAQFWKSADPRAAANELLHSASRAIGRGQGGGTGRRSRSSRVPGRSDVPVSESTMHPSTSNTQTVSVTRRAFLAGGREKSLLVHAGSAGAGIAARGREAREGVRGRPQLRAAGRGHRAGAPPARRRPRVPDPRALLRGHAGRHPQLGQGAGDDNPLYTDESYGPTTARAHRSRTGPWPATSRPRCSAIRCRRS